MIDEQLNNASDLISKQASQVRDLASQHTSKAMEASQGALSSYSAKASEMIGGAKKFAVDKGYVSAETAAKTPGGVKKTDFPTAPSTSPSAKSDSPQAIPS